MCEVHAPHLFQRGANLKQFKMNTQQILPKGQRGLIIKALKAYQKTLEIYIEDCDTPTYDELSFDIYDITGLIGLLEYDVTINLPTKIKEHFCHYHNVDFPLYDKVDLEYPLVDEREFAVFWLPGAYETHSETYNFQQFYNNCFYEEFIKVIDNLDVSDRTEQEDVLVIRIK